MSNQQVCSYCSGPDETDNSLMAVEAILTRRLIAELQVWRPRFQEMVDTGDRIDRKLGRLFISQLDEQIARIGREAESE
jgi:hypothetical protein